MSITARVIKDSLSEAGTRLTTMVLRYPRFIHSEFMTHRVFSHNASSSRAIPVAKLVQLALDDPAEFVHIGRNKPGMQASSEVEEVYKDEFRREWRELAQISARFALRWSNELGIHKQVVNRVMEPWHHITVIVTATEWANFLTLCDHPLAQPEIRQLAFLMRCCLDDSVQSRVRDGQWHLPFVSYQEQSNFDLETCLKMSVARCARVSLLNHDGTDPSVVKDMALHDDLLNAEPMHASPFEHQATPAIRDPGFMSPSNFRGWVQYRKFVECGLSPTTDMSL